MAKKTTPKIGDAFLLHGVRHTVASVGKTGRITVEPAKNPKSTSHTLLPDDLAWSDADEAWTLPGRTEPVIPGAPPKLTSKPPAEG